MNKQVVNQLSEALEAKLKNKLATATNDSERTFLQQQHNRQVDQVVFVLSDEIETAGISLAAFRENAGRVPFLIVR